MDWDLFDFDLDGFDSSSTPSDSHITHEQIAGSYIGSYDTAGVDFHNEFLGNLIGNPQFDASHFHEQSYDNTCAIVAQQGILESHGIVVSEDELMRIAAQNGWFTQDGTLMNDMGELLEHFGIDIDYGSNASIHDLVAQLSQGEKVIVGLDASEIWSPESNGDFTNWYAAELPDQGHAVWITGIDLENEVVYMNDSGISNGGGRAVALSDFMNAWEDFGNNYCTTV